MSTYTACLVHFIVMKYYLNTNKSLAIPSLAGVSKQIAAHIRSLTSSDAASREKWVEV